MDRTACVYAGLRSERSEDRKGTFSEQSFCLQCFIISCDLHKFIIHCDLPSVSSRAAVTCGRACLGGPTPQKITVRHTTSWVPPTQVSFHHIARDITRDIMLCSQPIPCQTCSSCAASAARSAPRAIAIAPRNYNNQWFTRSRQQRIKAYQTETRLQVPAMHAMSDEAA